MGVFLGWLLGEFVVTITVMVTSKVAASAAAINKGIVSEISGLFERAVLTSTAAWYSSWRVTTELQSAIELVSSFSTSSSS